MGFYGLAAALWIASAIFIGSAYYAKGSASRNSEIAEYQAAIAISEKLAREAEARAKEVAARVVVEYRDRVKVIREPVPGETQLIEVIRETPGLCAAPPAVRLLHDSAASGSALPDDPARTDAAPVPIETLAQTVVDNYRIARENAARLEALQEIVRNR